LLYERLHEITKKLTDDKSSMKDESQLSSASEGSTQVQDEWVSMDFSKCQPSPESSSMKSPNDSSDMSKQERPSDIITIDSPEYMEGKSIDRVVLPPPPPYSEEQPVQIASFDSCPQEPGPSTHLSHSWHTSSRPSCSDDESSIEFTSTGVEMEDGPPPYDEPV
uniref:Polo-like kinase 1 substrate 1 n=1 Tax=Gongylonema pulchrum TaxID=637853 RepID=A0A183CZ64_9BILA